MMMFTGTRPLTASSITMMSLQQRVYAYDQREVLMPSVLNSLKAGDEVRMARRRLLFWLAVSVLVVLPVAYVSALTTIYKLGGVRMQYWTFISFSQAPYRIAANQISQHEGTRWVEIIYLVIGAGVVGLLQWLRILFPAWPLHPIGFVMAGTYALHTLWFSFLIGWLIKAIVLHYGGSRGFHLLRTAFLGMILGDCLMGGVWMVAAWFTRVSFLVMPN
jgi:hypothetical protein